jgi:hypothetical protein
VISPRNLIYIVTPFPMPAIWRTGRNDPTPRGATASQGAAPQLASSNPNQ